MNKCHLLLSPLQCRKIFTDSGSDVTVWHRHIVLWRVPCIVWLLLLLWMTTDKWARYGVCSPFSCNIKPCIDHTKATSLRTAFQRVLVTRLLTGIVLLPKGGSKPDCGLMLVCFLFTQQSTSSPHPWAPLFKNWSLDINCSHMAFAVA